MGRHFAGAYVLATVDLVVGCPMTLAACQLGQQVYRHSNPQLDYYLAASALALTGVNVTAAAAATMLHNWLPYSMIRGARIVAAISELWMMMAGPGMIWVRRTRGGDWAGVTILGGTVFLAVGTLLLLLSLFGLRYIRRMNR